MLNSKADFILEYNEKMKNNLKRDDVDWSQSRVIFIANSFTTYQQKAVNFKDLPIELWEVRKYENNTIQYEQLKSPDSSESIKTISKSETVKNVSSEITKYSVDDLFKESWVETRELFDKLNEKLLSEFPELQVVPTKNYVGYKLNQKLLILIQMFKGGPSIQFSRSRPEDFRDPEKKLKYQENSFKNYHQHQSDLWVKSVEDIDYAMTLIRQAHKKMAEE